MPCTCEACTGVTPKKAALGPLPYSEAPSGAKYQMSVHANTLKTASELFAQIEAGNIEAVLSNSALPPMLYGFADDHAVKTALLAILYPVWAAGDKQSQLDWNDYMCNSCGHYVSKVQEFTHWDDICGTCSNHSGSTGMFPSACSCCKRCGYEFCECCITCGKAPGWCECCSYCGESEEECSCSYCEECEEKNYNCSCGSSYDSSYGGHKFGSIKKAPWTERSKPSLPLSTVPSMSDCDNDNIDPIQMAADFYLLDALKNNVRMNYIRANDAASERIARFDPRADDRLSALILAANRSYNALVERCDRSLLAYAVSVCGGELRYHRALSGTLPSSRSSAWNAFTSILEENGADVMFDAVDLFEDFQSASYGGHKWAMIAQVAAQRLSGKMPAWLFVDRIITLQHNGGCVLNKVNWARKNGLGWDIGNMQTFLNAHAGVCLICGMRPDESGWCRCGNAEECPDRTIDADWDLLLRAASPGVSEMFKMYESCLQRVARRVGAEMPRIPVSPVFAKKAATKASGGYCYNCGYYGCIC